jgi:hypothetical protein
MNLSRAAVLSLALLPVAAMCQTAPAVIPAGTPLVLRLDRHYPMRAGQPLSAQLLYPIYADNNLVLPAKTVVTGSVVQLLPDHNRRVHALLGGDFTPFHIPEVRFTQITLPDGAAVPLASGPAATGAQVYRATAPPPSNGSFLRRQFDAGLTAARSDLAFFIAPGKGDRLLQFIYGQIPYHPQRIEKGTSWTVETTSAVDLPAQLAAPPPVQPSVRKPHFWEEQVQTAVPETHDSGSWIVQANLAVALSSETSVKGQAIQALVADPIYNADRSIAVPQGAMLVGAVTRAKPSRRFGRSGTLSFSFSQLTLPGSETQTVETRLVGADSAQQIALNSEGQAKSRPQDKIAVPLFIAVLASRPLDQDRGHAHDMIGKDAIGGAAGLGLVGTVVGMAGGSPYVAAGIGYWGAARAFYSRWIAHGQKISFAKDTRIVVETRPRHSAPMMPNPQPPG